MERLLEVGKEKTVKELVDNINKIVDRNFNILSSDDDIEKWNSVPKLLMLSEEKQERLLNFIEYIDNLLISIEDKTLYIISLSGLIEIKKLNILDYDDGSLFTLANYYSHINNTDIRNTFSTISNKELLLTVRKKTLDIDTRKKILTDVAKTLKDDKISDKKIDKFILTKINEIRDKDYYELVN